MIIATASWSWFQFSILSLLVISPIPFLAIPALRSHPIARYVVAVVAVIATTFTVVGFETKDPSSPCPDLYQVGLGLFASFGVFVSSLMLLWSRFKWLIILPVLWLGYYAPTAISDLMNLWKESSLYH